MYTFNTAGFMKMVPKSAFSVENAAIKTWIMNGNIRSTSCPLKKNPEKTGCSETQECAKLLLEMFVKVYPISAG